MEKEALIEVINEWMRRYLPHSTKIRIYKNWVAVLADMILDHIVNEVEKRK